MFLFRITDFVLGLLLVQHILYTECTPLCFCTKAFEQILKSGQEGTLNIFFTILQWSFTILQAGAFPSHDWENKAYPEGSWEWKMAGKNLAGG